MSLQLRDLKIGDSARIRSLARLVAPFRCRLLSLGLLPGTLIKLIRRAPLGDPIEILLPMGAICLRLQEAGQIEVERLCAE